MNLLIADHHPLLRSALCRSAQGAEAHACVHEATGFQEVQALCASIAPALALIDLDLPGMNGLQGVHWLRERFSCMALIVASGQEDGPTIRAVLATGARGFFPKSAAPELLPLAIRLVQAGSVYVPVAAIADITGIAHRPTTQPAGPAAAHRLNSLTPRQSAVLQGLLRGLPNKLIARELGLTEGTVKIHIAAILRALQARNRTEAVIRARELSSLETCLPSPAQWRAECRCMAGQTSLAIEAAV